MAEPVVACTAVPVATVTVPVPVAVVCAWVGVKDEERLMACALAWPPTNPTRRSPAGTLIGPTPGVVLVLDVPLDTSNGVLDMPENSCTWNAVVPAAVWTVTDPTPPALTAYHISPSELWPAEMYAPTAFQVLPPESVTEVMWFVEPV